MKTVTEFSGFTLQDALKKQKALTDAGKSADEVSQELATSFKLEGDKLKHFLNALESVKERSQHLKRVVVLTFDEKEKKPEKILEKDGSYYLSEYFYVPQPTRKKKRFDGKKPGGKGKGGGGRRFDKRKFKPRKPKTQTITPVAGTVTSTSK